MTPDVKDDPVNHPTHYTQYEHEVIELTSQLGFCMGNAAKYILRAEFKGRKVEDLQKAMWYLEYAIEHGLTDKDVILSGKISNLAQSYKSQLLLLVLFDPKGKGRAALEGAIHRAQIDALEEENASLRQQNTALKQQNAAQHLVTREFPGSNIVDYYKSWGDLWNVGDRFPDKYQVTSTVDMLRKLDRLPEAPQGKVYLL